MIPHRIKEALKRYVLDRLKTGRGLHALLENDWAKAVACCDAETRAAFHPLMIWFHNEAPWECHGSPEKVAAWLEGEGTRWTEAELFESFKALEML